ncbi:hypothetical protein [Pontibacter flavimaris]|uniref:Uncharacterized protein n=1 Tax=Pontibacter flavimaris TaxID=1797110 RepID=A0A1Q5PE16_9BACT|nr:hypothetical protein [Pontibacter flavimaris]OKL40464.1 hypothetical protein A3841_19370 [Pontibacter flavimaris]
MTDISTEHPDSIPSVELLNQGRRINFSKHCLGDVKVRRSVNKGSWDTLTEQARSPYIDQDDFPAGTHLLYEVELEQDNERKKYELEVSL